MSYTRCMRSSIQLLGIRYTRTCSFSSQDFSLRSISKCPETETTVWDDVISSREAAFCDSSVFNYPDNVTFPISALESCSPPLPCSCRLIYWSPSQPTHVATGFPVGPQGTSKPQIFLLYDPKDLPNLRF